MSKIKDKDEFDYHVPTFDRKEFKDWAIKVVLPAIRVTPVGTRQIRKRVGSALGDERVYSLALGLEYLVREEKIWIVEQHVTMYTTRKPKEKSVSIPKSQWNEGVGLPSRNVPHYQEFGNKVTA